MANRRPGSFHLKRMTAALSLSASSGDGFLRLRRIQYCNNMSKSGGSALVVRRNQVQTMREISFSCCKAHAASLAKQNAWQQSVAASPAVDGICSNMLSRNALESRNLMNLTDIPAQAMKSARFDTLLPPCFGRAVFISCETVASDVVKAQFFDSFATFAFDVAKSQFYTSLCRSTFISCEKVASDVVKS